MGNFPQIAEAGNFNQFLVDLHQKFGPIASFWYGKHYTVSLAGTEVFRQITSLFDRSG